MRLSTIRGFCLGALVLLIAALFVACSDSKSGSQQRMLTVGESRLAVKGGSIWYKVTGEGRGMPLMLLHGGPGFSSYYLKPFEDLCNDRQVIRYDQLGAGKSERITDTTMFNVEHFVAELDSIRKHFRLEKWHLLGHSWGTILALEYYRMYPEHVASLILESPVFDIPAYETHVRQLLASSPDSLQQAVKQAEATGKYDDPGYQSAMAQFYSLYVYRHPVQADLDSVFATMNQELYMYMQGPSEFTITGTLKNYNATSFLPEVKVPTLFTAGEFDEVGPELTRGFTGKVPGARYVQFAGAAHITPWDARDENVKVVREFLNGVDKPQSK